MMVKAKVLRRFCVVVFMVGVCFLILPAASATPISPISRGSGGSGGNSVKYLYQSPLTVVEKVTDIGGGSYKYEYSFTNVDTSDIWGFGVWTTFVISDMPVITTFTECPTWGAVSYPVDDSVPEYDPRNLDPAIVYHADTWTEPFFEPFAPINCIPVNQAVSGFSFTSNHYDPSPKYYNYETIASGYALTNGGYLAAVGQTVPEPGTILLLGFSGLALLKKRRREFRMSNFEVKEQRY